MESNLKLSVISTALPHRNREVMQAILVLVVLTDPHMQWLSTREAAHAKDDLCNSSNVLENL